MANSLRAKLSKLRHDGNITDAEYQELIKKLDGHDMEIYGLGYNQGTIDRAEEVTKAREQGYAKAIEDFAERLKQRVSRHYVDCDAYFGGIAEEILYADYIDEIAEEMRGAE